jgi:hypoxanthine-DNA glycosylase
VLILGSFPSTASLGAQQYYAHPQNHFWRILGAILDRPLVDMDYAARAAAVQAAGIAIWDVYGACRREGSLDSAIRAAVANDVAALRKLAPQLRRVCFNGQTAGRFAAAMQGAGYEAVILPSTSPANARQGFEAKLARWRDALSPLVS